MKNSKLAALRAAFPYTVPIFAGFWFLAMAYGIQMSTSGFSFWYPMIMSAVIYGGSLEFVAVSMLLSPFEIGNAGGRLRSAGDRVDDPDGQCPAFFLRHFHAG